MPSYRSSHTLPVTIDHISKVLAKIRPEEWKLVRNAAKNALLTNNLEEKIKPSSLKLIAGTDRPATLITHIVNEHIGHADPKSEVHLGGGIHHGLKTIFSTIWNFLGGNAINRLFRKNKQQSKLTKEQHQAAMLISKTYAKDRPESAGGWDRLTEYDSNYGSIWHNSNGEYLVSVRGTKLKFADLWKDGKLLVGSTTQRDKGLEESITKFVNDHPNVKYDISAHSLGTELVMNYLNEVGFDHVDDVFLYNPASSFAQSKEHIRQNIRNPKVNLFLNANDPVGSYYSQMLDGDKNVWWGEFNRNPIGAHSLSQWYDEDESASPEKSESVAPTEHTRLPPEDIPKVKVI